MIKFLESYNVHSFHIQAVNLSVLGLLKMNFHHCQSYCLCFLLQFVLHSISGRVWYTTICISSCSSSMLSISAGFICVSSCSLGGQVWSVPSQQPLHVLTRWWFVALGHEWCHSSTCLQNVHTRWFPPSLGAFGGGGGCPTLQSLAFWCSGTLQDPELLPQSVALCQLLGHRVRAFGVCHGQRSAPGCTQLDSAVILFLALSSSQELTTWPWGGCDVCISIPHLSVAAAAAGGGYSVSKHSQPDWMCVYLWNYSLLFSC